MTEPAKDFREDYYTGLKGIYFYRILKTIIRIGELDRRDVRILDFGCGTGKLKQLLGDKVIGYDLLPELTDVDDWWKVKFDVLVANEVFYLLTRPQLENFLAELEQCNPQAELIVGISRQGILNKSLKVLAGQKDAHAGTKLPPQEELAVLQGRMRLVKKKTVFRMCDVCLLQFDGPTGD